MRGIMIRDGTEPGGQGGLAFDLAEVLAAIGERVGNSSWRARDLWYVSVTDTEIEPLERLDAGELVDGSELLGALPRLRQVIDGQFEGVQGEDEPPWVVVRAIDSSWWEVYSDDPAVLANLRARFRAVEDLPQSG